MGFRVALCLSIALCTQTCCGFAFPPKIAIIGGGIGGTSCAYFMRQHFGSDASITLFEKNEIGGRISKIELSSQQFEAGSVDIHPGHKYMVEFAKILGLTRKKKKYRTWGIFNGEKIVFEASPWTAITVSKLFWRYGWSMFQFDAALKTLNSDFARIYTAQDKGIAFASVTSLLAHMNSDFADMTTQTLTSYLNSKGISDLFVDELAQAVTLANFGQTNDISAFVVFVWFCVLIWS